MNRFFELLTVHGWIQYWVSGYPDRGASHDIIIRFYLHHGLFDLVICFLVPTGIRLNCCLWTVCGVVLVFLG